MEDLKYWIWFSRIENLGSIRGQKLIEKYHSPKEIWKLKKEELESVEGIGEKISNEILSEKYRYGLGKIEDIMKQKQIKLINFQEEIYPKKLKNIYDMPICLYVKGNVQILNEFSLAIIGCRENTEYGKKVSQAIGKGLAKKNIITVSGLARGIDSISQKATIEAKGKTIAVIGSGIDSIYPPENSILADEIVKCGGAIVSEYVPGSKAKRMNFPARNRIISGLSDGVIVIEAKNKSGTMTTVDFALEQGKAVFAIPRKYYKQGIRGNK